MGGRRKAKKEEETLPEETLPEVVDADLDEVLVEVAEPAEELDAEEAPGDPEEVPDDTVDPEELPPEPEADPFFADEDLEEDREPVGPFAAEFARHGGDWYEDEEGGAWRRYYSPYLKALITGSGTYRIFQEDGGSPVARETLDDIDLAKAACDQAAENLIRDAEAREEEAPQEEPQQPLPGTTGKVKPELACFISPNSVCFDGKCEIEWKRSKTQDGDADISVHIKGTIPSLDAAEALAVTASPILGIYESMQAWIPPSKREAGDDKDPPDGLNFHRQSWGILQQFRIWERRGHRIMDGEGQTMLQFDAQIRDLHCNGNKGTTIIGITVKATVPRSQLDVVEALNGHTVRIVGSPAASPLFG